MHSIERYGIVALLFLVVTVVAVLMWDGGKDKRKEELAGGRRPDSPVAPAQRSEQDLASRRLSLLSESRPGPLARPSAATEPAPLAAGIELEDVPPATPEDGTLETLPGAAALSSDSGASASRPTQSRREEPAPEQVVGARPSGTREYRVSSGDTLSEIAQRELGSSRRWQEIVAVNPGLDPARLQAGRTIRIPGAAGEGTASPARAVEAARATAQAPAKSVPASAKPAAAKGGTWKVGAGESLWKIAAKALGDGKRWREIAALNPGVDPDRLRAGQVLTLPAGSAARTQPSAAPASAPRSTKASAPVVADRVAPSTQARRGGKVK